MRPFIAFLLKNRYANAAGSFFEMDFSSGDSFSSSTSLFIAANALPVLFTIRTKSTSEMPRRLRTDFTCFASAMLRVVRIGRDDFTRNIAGLLPSLRATGFDCSKVLFRLSPIRARRANPGHIEAIAAALSTALQQNAERSGHW